ncbi:MAG: BatD family protein [Candidatus Omnitrophica bacterium]|nr:BatD family protein [Candidatus Omnitrophota bacterium]
MGKQRAQGLERRVKMQKFKLLSFILAFCILPFMLVCYASDIQFEATVDRNKIALGEAFQLNLAFHGTQNVSPPGIDKIEGFEMRYVGPSTMVSIVNGVVTSSITHIYTLIPLKTGIFTIGPFSVDMQGKTLTSKPITIEVVSASSAGQSYSRQQSLDENVTTKINSEELKDRIFLVLSAAKRKVYLNEVIPLTIKLYINRLSVRDIQFPVIETNDFSIEKFGQPRQYREELGGVLYDVIEFTTDMFAIKPGEFSLGPAKLKCNLVVRRQAQRRRTHLDDDFFGGFFNDDIFDNFFGRYDAYPLELKSAEFPITVLPLPEEGKPEGFDGALGDFQLNVTATPLEVKAGDPITLKMTIRGEGNFDSVKSPKLQSKDGFKVYDPQVKQNESEKIFEQVIIPESEKITHIPQISFSFFNTESGQYETLTHQPIPITVFKVDESQTKLIELPQTQVKAVEKEELGRDIIYLKNSPGQFRRIGRYLYKSLSFWCLQVLSFIIFLSVLILHLRQQRLSSDQRYARRLQAPLKAKKSLKEIERLLREKKTEAFFNAVFKTIREYLADRFHLPAGGITADTFEEVAKERGIAQEALEKIKKIFTACDMARYAPGQFNPKQMEAIFQDLKEIIVYLERQKI